MRYGTGTLSGVDALWGIEPGSNEILFCELAEERVLIQMDDTIGTRKFRDLICIYVEILGQYVTVANEISAAFDVENAQGEQLDFIGSLIDLPRQGFNDDTLYRAFLTIQIDLILAASRSEANWTGTHNNILSICRTFMDAIGVGGTIVLNNFAPYSFSLSIPGITDPVEFNILIGFICKALYAGVLGQIIQTLGPDSLWNSDSVAVPEGGTWCSLSVPIPGCATWGTSTPIGLCPPPS